MSLQIPVPDSLLAAVRFGIGLTFGRALARTSTDPHRHQTRLSAKACSRQTLIKNALDLLHHFWVSLLLLI